MVESSDPSVGDKHHVVIHVNNSIALGLITKPLTYRVRQSPTFLPSLNPNSARGTGRSGWKTWSQFRFDGGQGQVFFRGAQANNRFAESNMIDIGLPMSAIGGVAGVPDPSTVQAVPGDSLDNNPIGDIQVALMPRGTTAETPLHTLFTNAFPVFVVSLSNRPHMFHHRSAFIYTNVTDTALWEEGSIRGGGDPMTGKWVVINTQLGGGQGVVGAVAYSGVVMVGLENSGVYVYGSNTTANDSASDFYAPIFNTTVGHVKVYDRKLWRTDPGKGRAAFFSNETGEWSRFLEIGEAGSKILNLSVFNGRLYFGLANALWVFDAGRTYQIEDFSDQEDPNNFNMMVSHRGSLYFNIKQQIVRYSSAGLIELLITPNFSGVVVGGTSMGGELHILTRSVEGDGKVYVFNSETGGTRQWFRSKDFAENYYAETGPRSLTQSQGQMWIAPIYMSAAFNTMGNSSPIASVNKLSPSYGLSVPYFGKSHARLITSMIDFGHEGLSKQIKDLLVEYSLFSTNDRIDISYITDIKGSALKAAHTFLSSSFTDVTTVLSNGSANPADGKATGTYGIGDFLYVGFYDPVEGMRVILDESVSASPKDYVVEYHNGTIWTVVPLLSDSTRNLTRSGYMKWGEIKDITLKTENGTEAYYFRIATRSSSGSAWSEEADGDISDFAALVPAWDQTADIEEGDTTDFDTVEGGTQANEDFTTFTEVDGSGVLTVTPSKITGVNVDRDLDAYVSKDKGVDNYNKIDINFELFMDSASVDNTETNGAIALTVSAVGDITNFGTSDIVVISREFSGPNTIRLWRGNKVAEDTFTMSLDTIYYCTLLRTANSDTVTVEIYSDSDRTTLLDTLSLSGFGTGTKYRYLYGSVNYNTGHTGRDWDGYSQNMQDNSNLSSGGFVANTVSALKGTYGIEVTVDSSSDVYGTLEDATNLTELSVEFLFDPNGLTMANGDVFTLMQARGSGSGGVAFRINLSKTGSNYEISAAHINDSGSGSATNAVVISDAPHSVRVHWKASTGPGNNDGELTLFIDEVRIEKRTGLDSDGHDVDDIRFGAMGVDAGTSGTFYLDEMRWDATIGNVIEGQFGGHIGKYVWLIADTDNQYAPLDGPTNETDIIIEASVNFDEMDMVNGDEFDILQARGSGSTATTAILRLKKDGSAHKIKLSVFNEADTEFSTSYYTVPAGDHVVRIEYVVPSSPGANDGTAKLILDEGDQEELTGLDTDGYDIDDIRFGVVSGCDATTFGTLLMDNCRWLAGTVGGAAVTFTELNGVGTLLGQQWVSLGSITDPTEETATFSFPDKYTTEEIMLRFDLFGTDITRPEIRRYTYQYEVLPHTLMDVNFTTVAADRMELADLSLEHSGAFIAAALFSMVMAGTRHVVQIPWPTNENGTIRTINAKIRLSEPGTMVPIIPFMNTVTPYDNSFIGAEIPLRLEEM